MSIKYQVIAKYIGQTQEWIAYEDKLLEKAKTEGKKLKSKYGDHIKFKLIKITEERIKL